MSNNIKFNFFFLIIISTIYILLIFQIIKQQILYPLCKNYIKIVRTECYKIISIKLYILYKIIIIILHFYWNSIIN